MCLSPWSERWCAVAIRGRVCGHTPHVVSCFAVRDVVFGDRGSISRRARGDTISASFPGCRCALAVICALSRSRTGMSTGSSSGLADSRFVRRGVSFETGRAALPSGRMIFLFLCTIRFVEGWGEFERTGSFNLVPGSTVLASTYRARHVLLAL